MKQLILLRSSDGGLHCFGGHLVILLTILSQFQPRPVSGFQCYECTSEEPGCDKEVATTPGLKKECAAEAIGCAIYAVYYDYMFGDIYHRSCIYSYDIGNYSAIPAWIELEDNGIGELDFVATYYYAMEAWANLRKKAVGSSAPPVVQAKHAPKEAYGLYTSYTYLKEKYGELSNGAEFSNWTRAKAFVQTLNKLTVPNITNSVKCYSCEFEIKGYRIFTVEELSFTKDEQRQYNLPPCGSKDASPLKVVTCKNAYGCATLLEMKNASNAMYVNGIQKNDVHNSISRVWRGCWYPGDQKCLRHIESLKKSADRNLKSFPKGMKGYGRQETGTEQCDRAYKRYLRTGDGVVEWAGVKPISTSEEYNLFLQCRHEVRLGVNAESQLKLVQEKVDKEYTWIQYFFCGPQDKCNRYVEVEGDAVGKGKYNPEDYDEVEGVSKKKNRTSLDDCETEEDFKNNGSVLSIGISSVSKILLLFSAAYFLF